LVRLIMRMLVRVGVGVRVRMVVAVVVPRPVLMFMRVFMGVLVVMSAYTTRTFAGQPASAVFTHYSISSEANSISRPARSSPLGVWHPGHSANRSSD
jgi:hypothetical protein